MSTWQVYDLNYMKKVHPRQTSHVLWRSPPAKWLNKTGQSKPNRPLGAPCAPWRMNKCMVGGRRCIWATQNLHTHTMVHTLDFGGFVKPSALYSSASGGWLRCCNWVSAAREMPPEETAVSLCALLFLNLFIFGSWYPSGTRQVPTKRKKSGLSFYIS